VKELDLRQADDIWQHITLPFSAVMSYKVQFRISVANTSTARAHVHRD